MILKMDWNVCVCYATSVFCLVLCCNARGCCLRDGRERVFVYATVAEVAEAAE